MAISRKAGKIKKQKKNFYCPKCGGSSQIRNGYVNNEQRWKCKSCLYQYTRLSQRGKPFWQKSLAILLYSHGVSLRAISRIFHIQPSTVLKWINSYGGGYIGEPEGSVSVNDMQNYLKKKSGNNSALLCIAIEDPAFKKSLRITINDKRRKGGR